MDIEYHKEQIDHCIEKGYIEFVLNKYFVPYSHLDYQSETQRKEVHDYLTKRLAEKLEQANLYKLL